MKKRRLPHKICLLVVLVAALGLGLNSVHRLKESGSAEQKSAILDAAKGIFDREPSEVQELREQSVAETDEAGYQEYYFTLANTNADTLALMKAKEEFTGKCWRGSRTGRTIFI